MFSILDKQERCELKLSSKLRAMALLQRKPLSLFSDFEAKIAWRQEKDVQRGSIKTESTHLVTDMPEGKKGGKR